MKRKVIGTNLVSLIELNGGIISTRLRWHAMPKHARPVGTIVRENEDSVLVTNETPFQEAISRMDAALAIHEIIGAVPGSLFEGIIEGWRLAEIEVDDTKAVAALTRALHVDAPRATGLIVQMLDSRETGGLAVFEELYHKATRQYTRYCKENDVTKIIGEPYDDDWECLCGNDTSADGFYPVHEGHWIEPLIASPWDSRSVGCASCGRIIDQSTTKVVGRMTDEALAEPMP